MNNTRGNAGIGFTGLLALLFVTLKLTGVISWSWLWVLSPLWIGLAIGLFIFGLFALLAILAIWLAK